MTISHDANSSTQGGSVSSRSWSHTNNGNALVVGIGLGHPSGGAGVSTVTYNGISLTKINHRAVSQIRTELWYILNPASGTNTIIATFNSTNIAACGGTSLSGVLALDANNIASANSTAPAVVVTTIADNCWVVDALTVEFASTITVGSGQTQRWLENVSTAMRGRGSTEGAITPAGNVTMDWTLSPANDWAMVAASFKPAIDIKARPIFF